MVGVVECAEVEGEDVDFFAWEVELAEVVEGEESVNKTDLEVGKVKVEDAGLTCLDISDLCFQYQPLMAWASMQRPWSMVGLPM